MLPETGRRTLGWAGTILLFAAAPALVYGQERGKAQKERIKVSGELKGAQRGLLHVVTKEGDQYLVKVDAKPQDIQFTGSAHPSFLRPGMMIRFTARFNKKGQTESPVDRLIVFTPNETTRLGVIADSGLGGKDLFSSEKPEDKAKAAARNQFAPFVVAGRLTAVRRGGKLTVAAGRTPLKVELADGADISVQVADYRLARVGDRISLDGWHLPGQKTLLSAQRVEISAAAKLGEKPKQPAATTKETKP